MDIVQYVRNLHGGAGVFATRLHRCLREHSIRSRLITREGAGRDTGAESGEFGTKDWAASRTRTFLERLIQKANRTVSQRNSGPFLPITRPFRTQLNLPNDFSGVVHLHWIAQWMDLRSALSSLPRHVPVLVSLHDVTSLTGGCCIYNGCDRFMSDCSPCPILRAPFDRFLAKRELRRKQRAYSLRDVHVVGNSAWTTEKARASKAFSSAKGFYTVHPGLPPDFTAVDKRAARNQLGLPSDARILGFAAAAITDGNKQFDLFARLVARLNQERPCIGLVIGEGCIQPLDNPEIFRFLGKLDSHTEMSTAYSAMDLFIFPSRMESFGQVAAEASLCGTPTCAFSVGGIPEVVIHNHTGLLAAPYDDEQLYDNIQKLDSDSHLLCQLGTSARAYAQTRFSMARFAQDYISIYSQALQATRKT